MKKTKKKMDIRHPQTKVQASTVKGPRVVFLPGRAVGKSTSLGAKQLIRLVGRGEVSRKVAYGDRPKVTPLPPLTPKEQKVIVQRISKAFGVTHNGAKMAADLLTAHARKVLARDEARRTKAGGKVKVNGKVTQVDKAGNIKRKGGKPPKYEWAPMQQETATSPIQAYRLMVDGGISKYLIHEVKSPWLQVINGAPYELFLVGKGPLSTRVLTAPTNMPLYLGSVSTLEAAKQALETSYEREKDGFSNDVINRVRNRNWLFELMVFLHSKKASMRRRKCLADELLKLTNPKE